MNKFIAIGSKTAPRRLSFWVTIGARLLLPTHSAYIKGKFIHFIVKKHSPSLHTGAAYCSNPLSSHFCSAKFCLFLICPFGCRRLSMMCSSICLIAFGSLHVYSQLTPRTWRCSFLICKNFSPKSKFPESVILRVSIQTSGAGKSNTSILSLWWGNSQTIVIQSWCIPISIAGGFKNWPLFSRRCYISTHKGKILSNL